MGLLVGIETIARHIHDLDAVEGDVVVEGRGVGFGAAIKAIDITGGRGLVAIDCEALNGDILGGFDRSIGVCAA